MVEKVVRVGDAVEHALHLFAFFATAVGLDGFLFVCHLSGCDVCEVGGKDVWNGGGSFFFSTY